MKMQTAQATGMKRFTYNHLGIMALTLSLVVSSLTAMTTLSITGDLPWQQHSTASALPHPSPRYVERKEARQEALELQAGKLYGSALALINEQRYFERKDARQDALELQIGQLNRRVSPLPAPPHPSPRYVELKEARQDALELQMGQLYSPTPLQEAP
jgi:hypothetical protein